MVIKQELSSILEIANLHKNRINIALKYLKDHDLIKVTAVKISNFSNDDLSYLELLTTRFGKLQDFIGSKIFPLVLQLLQEDKASDSQIDRLNKLEKLEYLPSVKEWTEMREMRNHFTHEYPNDIELNAENLNYAIEYAKKLVDYWSVLENKISSLSKKLNS